MCSVLDSWGKLPSGILSGNNLECGEFAQCLRINRDGKSYGTQYCLGQIVIDFGSTINLRPRQNDVTNALILNHWQAYNEPQIMPRAILPM